VRWPASIDLRSRLSEASRVAAIMDPDSGIHKRHRCRRTTRPSPRRRNVGLGCPPEAWLIVTTAVPLHTGGHLLEDQ
jgi:hypothetical protein